MTGNSEVLPARRSLPLTTLGQTRFRSLDYQDSLQLWTVGKIEAVEPDSIPY